MSTPYITVLINTFNEREDWLKSAIKSYQNQTGVKVQIIVSAVRGDKNIPLIEQMGCKVVLNESPGIYEQINAALPFIEGEYTCYGSSNDIAELFKLRSEYDQCVKFSKMVCYSSFYKCDASLRVINTYKSPPYNYQSHLEKGNFINDCALVRTDILRKYTPFRTEWKNHAYYDLWLRIYEGEGDVFINNPTPTWFYRGHEGQKLKRQKSAVLMKDNRETRERMIAWHKSTYLEGKGVAILLKEPLPTYSDTKLTLDTLNNWANDVLNYVKPVTESTETHFVYVYVSSPAKWNELAISIQSIRKHFQGKAKFFCVGDPPGIKDVIHVPILKTKGRPSDIYTKLNHILKCEMINEDFIYCYDDQILLRPITAEWFDKIIANDYVKDFTTYWGTPKGVIPSKGWRALFLKTFATLSKKGLPTYNYETHIPRKLNKPKIQQTFDRFTEDICADALFNSLYFNLHYSKPDVLLKENTRIKAGLHRAFDKQERIIDEVKGRVWLNYSDPALNEIFRKTVTKIIKGEIKV